MTREEAQRKFAELCQKGLHPWEELLVQAGPAFSDWSAKWCPVCGAVVVDLEEDHRLVEKGQIRHCAIREYGRWAD